MEHLSCKRLDRTHLEIKAKSEQFNSMKKFAYSLLKQFISLIFAFLVGSALLKWTHFPVVPACNRGLCLNPGLDCGFATTWIPGKYWRRKWRRDRLCTSFVKSRGIGALLMFSLYRQLHKNISLIQLPEPSKSHPSTLPWRGLTIPGGGYQIRQ